MGYFPSFCAAGSFSGANEIAFSILSLDAPNPNLSQPRQTYMKFDGTEVRSSGQLGKGFFALRDFKKGDMVVKWSISRKCACVGATTAEEK